MAKRKSLVDFSNLGDTEFLDAKEQKSADADEHSFVSSDKQKNDNAKGQDSEMAGQQISGLTEEQESKQADQQNIKTANVQNSNDANEHNIEVTEVQNSKDANKQEDKPAEKMRRITFNIPESLYKKLKMISVNEDITLLDIGAAMAREYIEKRSNER